MNRKWRYSTMYRRSRRRKQNKTQNRWDNRGKRSRRKFTAYR